MTTHTVDSLMELADAYAVQLARDGNGDVSDEQDLRRDHLEHCLREALAQPATEPVADTKRIDWLEKLDGHFYNIDRITAVRGVGFNRAPNLRTAIDAAMEKKEPTP
jgi:hypothetical protein